MQLLVEYPETNEMKITLDGRPDRLELLTDEQFHLYQNVAHQGLAMSEYVYKLRGEEDPRWRDTVDGWVVEYQPLVLGLGIDCGDYEPGFVQVVEEALDVSREEFCLD